MIQISTTFRFNKYQVVTFLIVFVQSVSAIAQTPDFQAVRERYDRLHDQVLALQKGEGLDNKGGGIVWGSSYQMDSYITMFEATQDRKYLDHFISLADQVIAARADKRGLLDFRGRLTYGWPSGGHYTLGKPTTLIDAEGHPSLRVRTRANSYNDKTTIEVLPGTNDSSFEIKVVNFRNPEKPIEKVFSNLTIESVEETINPKPGQRGFLQVKRLGDRPPAPREPFTPTTELMTFHGHHTGRILTPIARFCALVMNDPDLSDYEPKASEYLHEVRISMVEHDQFFIEEEDHGYTIFEKGSPFWCDGVPEPHNTLACSGSTYLHLYRATGEPYYLDRATRLAKLFKKNHIEKPDGTWMFYYWYGLMHVGWTADANISENLPVYSGAKSAEDISHFQLTLLFLVDCFENGIVFEKEDLEKWATTFHKTIYEEDPQGPYLTFRVDGNQSGVTKGKSNHVLYGFIELGNRVDPKVVERCREILLANHSDKALPTVLFSLATLANAQRQTD